MKRNLGISRPTVGAMILVSASFTTARTDAQSATLQTESVATEKHDPGQPAVPSGLTLPLIPEGGMVVGTDPTAAPNPAPFRRANQLNRLRKAMDEPLKLSKEQKKATDLLFDDQTELLRIQANIATPGGKRVVPVQPKQTSENVDGEAKSVQVDECKPDASPSAAATSPAHATGAPREPAPPAEFIKKVAAELRPDQIEKFQELVDQYEVLLPPRGSRNGPMRRIRLAVGDPAVALSDEQGKDINEILKKHVRSVKPRDRELNPNLLVEAAARARVEVLEKLTPQQREKAEAILKTLDEAAAAEAAASLAKNVIPLPGSKDGAATKGEKDPTGD